MPNYQVKVSVTDTTPGYLAQKFVSDFGVQINSQFVGSDEQLVVGVTDLPSLPLEDDAGSFNGSANIFVDVSLVRRFTLDGNSTIGILGWASTRAQTAQFKVIQGAGGSHTLTFFGAKTPNNGGGLVLSTAAGAVDIVHVYNDGAGSVYAWVEGLGFA